MTDFIAAYEAVFKRPFIPAPRRPISAEEQRAIDRLESIAEDRRDDVGVSEGEARERQRRYDDYLEEVWYG
jgi:hypothetical protein